MEAFEGHAVGLGTANAREAQLGAAAASSASDSAPLAHTPTAKIMNEAAETWDLAMKSAKEDAKKKKTSILPSVFSEINLRSNGMVNSSQLVTQVTKILTGNRTVHFEDLKVFLAELTKKMGYAAAHATLKPAFVAGEAHRWQKVCCSNPSVDCL
uniref:Uncharacterized protein n=1 Tax=Chromera velia CCMP2878 TaxID=1169474 RepID=A0A0G4ID93_9ALVE|mmetsp:Transcript_659/g.1462  ORF Transcript_659/g.1462 Transcript_659/m.1462 type:complete len:155 (+) Transcript_659:1137-1601(+)|eukprot:Cvel_13314.t1-p1 / transcript=Cvel_13314.t1 / gene=Cvel_13314 / organism=Chromera_velia_CCMP2878 / gene_product=hypothetical protein / transcript_product=hypothetical protein / location=Cvel_scaffold903:51485-51946(+) / protein_length=154 / sequence_SO=supercontig / SO=protein_coding / is_pseudo=false